MTHVVAHVAIVLGHGQADVDRRLAGHHRHVGGVGHQQRALHQLATGARVFSFGKGLQHVDQFVAALAAADIDNDIGVGPARDLLLHHGLAGTEGAGHRALAALELREEGVDDALAGDQRRDAVVARTIGPGSAHRPAMIEPECMLLA
jgi:hypothetical protein